LRKFLVIAGALLLTLSIPQGGYAGGPGTYLAASFEVAAGPRQAGFGGAFTGFADDAMCVFYNPAGLKFIGGSEVHLTTSSWAAGISYQHLAYGFRHSYLPGIFAFSWAVMQMSPYHELTEYFDPDSEFGIGIGDAVDAGDMQFGGSYCWDFGDGLSVAGTLKWYHLGMAQAFCEGVAVDLGVLWETRLRNLRLGASAMNLGPNNKWNRTGESPGYGEEFPLPTSYRVGASIRLFDVVRHRVVVAADYVIPREGRWETFNVFDIEIDTRDFPYITWAYLYKNRHRMNIGTEYTFNRGRVFMFGRVGYRAGYDEEGLTLGAGLLFPTSEEADARIDYAWMQMTNLSAVHKVSVAFMF